MNTIEQHKPAKRIIKSILRPFEIKLLDWFVRIIPPSVTPNDLTAVGLFGAFLIMIGYFLSNFGYGWLWLVNFGLLVNWFGDSLDGSIARHRKIERPLYGFYIDHNVDVITSILIGLGLGLSPFMRFDVALYSIIGYLMLSIHTYINAYLAGFFKISYDAIGPTEVRVIIIIINSVLFFVHKNPSIGPHLTYFDVVGIIIGTLLIIAFFIAYFTDKKVIKEKDPPKY